MDMAGIGALLLLYVLFAFFLFSFNIYKKYRQLPPGPVPWSFLGNLFQKNVLPLYKSYPKLMEKYGPVFTIWMGPRPAVVLCGYEVIKDALLNHAEQFAGRPVNLISIPGTKGQTYGQANPPKLQAMRRFTLTTLRDFGMGKRRMSERVQEEALYLVKEIASSQGLLAYSRDSGRWIFMRVAKFCTLLVQKTIPNKFHSISALIWRSVSELWPNSLCERYWQNDNLSSSDSPALREMHLLLDVNHTLKGHTHNQKLTQPLYNHASRNGKWQGFDPKGAIVGAVSNVMCSVIFGSRFDYKDKVFLEQQRIVLERMNFYHTFSAMVYVSIPKIMKHLPGKHQKILAEGNKIYDFIRERVNSHKQSLDPQNPRDFIDCFLIKMEKDQLCSKVVINEEDFFMMILALFCAGVGNTSRLLLYSILTMAKFPHIQAKVQQEIAEVVGTIRPPNMEDRMKMPFTDAVAHEIQRYQKVSLETFARAVTRDTKFRGHTIPKGTTVIPLTVSSHFDPLHWEKPEEFNPGHFLDDRGQFRKKDALVFFLAGKRSCLGEALVNMKYFLFFSTLLQNFTFQLTGPVEKDLLSLCDDLHTKVMPLPLQAIRRPM